MDTNGTTNGKFRATNGHEWIGMNHEIHEREIQSHEWTRMDTKGKFRTTNGHEWIGMNHEIHERKIQNHERHERHELIV